MGWAHFLYRNTLTLVGLRWFELGWVVVRKDGLGWVHNPYDNTLVLVGCVDWVGLGWAVGLCGWVGLWVGSTTYTRQYTRPHTSHSQCRELTKRATRSLRAISHHHIPHTQRAACCVSVCVSVLHYCCTTTASYLVYAVCAFQRSPVYLLETPLGTPTT